ncbi:zona pellucida sperm-binding protein 3-like [Odontesthes bonariensis]|uniref:zona pellucida sperm-binding protein 3-like n=1 Tax=Odontesthes bonariensis TaxID=219752 RepID=UPI003F58D6DE
MDCNLRQMVSWWIVVSYSVFTLTEPRLVDNRGSSTPNVQTPVRTHGTSQNGLSAVQQQQSAEFYVRPRPVVVKCYPDSMEIVVQADLFDTGLKVDGEHLRLGLNSLREGSECGAVQSGEEEFTILTWLTGCGTKLSSTEEKIIYSNELIYAPEPSPDGLLRLDEATIPVECHYERRYSVTSASLLPTWIDFVNTVSVDDQIDFTLQIRTGDWQFERGSYAYYLGDPINFEVSAIMGNHMPLRVYVDHCVATATPDAEATLRHDFIENHGCLADAYLTNSNSRFLPRDEEHKLRFQLEAFKFYQEPSNQVYITCYVKAVLVTLPVGPKNRACSLIENRWQSVDGSDHACRSCDISQPAEMPLVTEPPKATLSTEGWPSMISQESLFKNKAEHHPASNIRYHLGSHNSPQVKSSTKLIKRDTDHKEQKTIQLGPLTVLPLCKYVTNGTESKMVLSQKKKTT